MMSSDAVVTVLMIFFAYAFIGNFIGNRYFRRKHGVKGRLGWVRSWDDLDAGIWEASFVSLIWPISLFLGWVKNPAPCTHQHHVLAREEARRRYDQAEEVIRRERGL
ncbi:MAG: hypothetical protein ACT4RN_03625 [Pseudonocardia sp.]